MAQERQKRSFDARKGKHCKSFIINPGDEVLRANKRKEGRKGGRLEANWSGPYVVASITSKGVATLLDSSGTQLKQCVNISQLKPFIRPTMRGNSNRQGYLNPPVYLLVAGYASAATLLSPCLSLLPYCHCPAAHEVLQTHHLPSFHLWALSLDSLLGGLLHSL